jgi:hypothetical protein
MTETATDPSKQKNAWDLAVCYRIYPRVSKNPVFSFTDKLALVRLNLESFKLALGGLRARIWILLDNCPPAYERAIRDLFPPEVLEIIALPGEGNRSTFDKQIEILSLQTDADLVYFAEDDYLYLPGSIDQAVSFFRQHTDVDFATLYDHPDYHTLQIHRLGKKTNRTTGEYCWKTVSATCLTFMSRRTILQESAWVFRTYRKGNSDLGAWIALTKKGVFDLRAIPAGLSDGRFCFASYLFAWGYAAKQILFGKRYTLWAPEPSLATHMENDGLAPGIDWHARFGARADELQAAPAQLF